MCGFSVSIHSKSAPFCSDVMQSSTQRSSPVPGLKANRPFGKRLARNILLSRGIMTSPEFNPDALSTSSPSMKFVYKSARSPSDVDTGIFCVRPAPNESVRATITPSSTPISRNAYRSALILAIKSSCGTVTFPS